MLVEFFGLFNPWEVEEINCIDRLIYTIFGHVFDTVKEHVDQQRSESSEPSETIGSEGAFDLTRGRLPHQHRRKCYFRLTHSFRPAHNRTPWVEGAATCGLKLLRRVLRTTDHEELVDTMQKNMTPSVANNIWINTVIMRLTQESRRETYPNDDHDKLETARQKLPFAGDKEDAPPLAWVILWKGTYSNTYGDLIPDSLHAWGYIFWDVQRLVRSGGKQRLLRAWDTWDPTDPREHWID